LICSGCSAFAQVGELRAHIPRWHAGDGGGFQFQFTLAVGTVALRADGLEDGLAIRGVRRGHRRRWISGLRHGGADAEKREREMTGGKNHARKKTP